MTDEAKLKTLVEHLVGTLDIEDADEILQSEDPEGWRLLANELDDALEKLSQ